MEIVKGMFVNVKLYYSVFGFSVASDTTSFFSTTDSFLFRT